MKKKKKPSISKLIQQVTRVKGGEPPTFNELTRIMHAAGISDRDLEEVEKGTPWLCDGVQCDFKGEVEKLEEKKMDDLPRKVDCKKDTENV